MEIREAILEDSEYIAELFALLGFPAHRARVRKRLSRMLPHADYGCFVAEDVEGLQGFIGAHRSFYFTNDGSYGRVTSLIVREEARRQGIGSALLRLVEDWLRGQGVADILVDIDDELAVAQDFYRSRGFEVQGLRLQKSLRQSDGDR